MFHWIIGCPTNAQFYLGYYGKYEYFVCEECGRANKVRRVVAVSP